jgi:hypothetical protein
MEIPSSTVTAVMGMPDDGMSDVGSNKCASSPRTSVVYYFCRHIFISIKITMWSPNTYIFNDEGELMYYVKTVTLEWYMIQVSTSVVGLLRHIF